MKASVIFGVLHMSMGIFTKGMNLAYNRQWLEIFTEVLTGLVILLGLFGWMDLQIFLKWFANPDIDDFSEVVPVPDDGSPVLYLSYKAEVDNSNMPSIISVLINSLLSPQICSTPSDPED
jgi:vacuolar-type H+-ATPase subunit I/STV1